MGRTIELAVAQRGGADRPVLAISISGAPLSTNLRKAVTSTLARMLGLDLDLAGFYALAASDSRLSDLALRFRGMRPPRFPSVFETLVNAICCQQISLAAGLTLLNRIAEKYGERPRTMAASDHAFPQPSALSRVRLRSLRALGLSRNKGRAIIELSRQSVSGTCDLEMLHALDDSSALDQLESLQGIGRWSAEYVLLRGLGRLHVFPGDDVGARQHLEEWLGLRRQLDYDGTRRVLARWHSFAGLVYLHLLLRRLEERGVISGTMAEAESQAALRELRGSK